MPPCTPYVDSPYGRIGIYTSSTRPTPPDAYEGKVIVESDTDRVMVFVSGTTWMRIGYYSLAGRYQLMLRRSTTQSFTSGVEDSISWTVEDSDTNSMIAVPAATITVPAALGGIWEITAAGVMASAIAARHFMGINTTAGVTGVPPQIRNSCYGEDRNYISIPNLPLAGSATLTCTIYQQSGGAVNLNSAWLNMTWKGP